MIVQDIGSQNTNDINNFNNTTPKTIDELKQWYKDRNLPDENITRFFIGKNYTKAKAFGIFRDEKSGNFIVYKNKANSVRVIRYEGPDEEYAVNELYLRLKEEIANQKARIKREEEYKRQYNSPEAKKARRKQRLFIGSILTLFIGLIIGINILTPNRGYYHYNNSYYYYQSGSWYLYDNYYGWDRTTAPKTLKKNHSDYYDSSYYNYYGIDRFEDSSYYVEPSSSSSSSDWDSGSSWDSSSTDWDSDW